MKVLRPHSLDEALELRARWPLARPIAGGTDVMVELNATPERPDALLDLSRVAQLAEISRDEQWLTVGAGVTYTRMLDELSDCVALAQAARTVGSVQIRNRGTLGGNLATASPAGDTLPVLAAYDAEVLLSSATAHRSVPVLQFLLGPKRTALAADELIVAARWPVARRSESFAKVGPRAAMVIAVASLAVVLDHDHRRVRVALGSVGPTVLRAEAAERFAGDALAAAGAWDDVHAPLAAGTAEEFGALVAAAARPIDDVRGSAAYRTHACRVLAARTLGWLHPQSGAVA